MIKMKSKVLHLFCVAFVVLKFSENLKSTTIDALTWEQLAIHSDFVGVVECVKAGSIVAGFKVSEVWKGNIKKDIINIRMSFDIQGPQLPFILCGEKYFITAFNKLPNYLKGSPGKISYSQKDLFPFWWRNIDCDLELPLRQGMLKLPTENHAKWGIKYENIEQLKLKLMTVLNANSEIKELYLLKSAVQKYLIFDKSYDEITNSMVADLETSKNLEEFFNKIIHLEAVNAKLSDNISSVLCSGEDLTISYIKKNISKFRTAKDLIMRIEWNKKTWNLYEDSLFKKNYEKASATILEDYKKYFLKNATLKRYDEKLDQAWNSLVQNRPKVIVEYLLKFHSDDTDSGYFLISHFAWLCRVDRLKYFISLTNADDPYIKVGSAIYLSFEDETIGITKLKQFAELPGDPGRWASLSLSRRGEKKYLTKILEAFDFSSEESNKFDFHDFLRIEALILISNSAYESNIYFLPEKGKVNVWWKENEPKLKIVDPWFDILKKQKID
jgi:hypothetical protein